MSRTSVILDVCARLLFHTLLVISLYFLFAGHNRPGGGFAGGLLASCAFCLQYLAGGRTAIQSIVRIPATTFLGVGLLLAAGAAFVPVLQGGAALQSEMIKAELALFGTVKFSSVLLVDSGVYLVVLGMVLLVLEQLGGEDGER